MFFDRFKALCAEKGVSPKRAVEEIGLSNSLATKWKKTGATPQGTTLQRIAVYFSVSTDYLLDKSDTKTANGAELYEIIRHLCDRREITFAELSEAVSLQEGLFAELKSGKISELSYGTLQKIADYFQVSMDIFSEGVFAEALPNAADADFLRELDRKFSLVKEKTPTENGERSEEDEFTYAMHEASRDLTQEDKQMLAEMAKMIAARRRGN